MATDNNKSLSIYYQNVRGLRTKTNIRTEISASQYDIIIFTEHWLNENFSSSEYFDENYFVERSDRVSVNKQWGGGGAWIAIKKEFSYKRIHEWEKRSPFESVWIEMINRSSRNKLFMNVVYIPPQTNYEVYSAYFDLLTEIMCVHQPDAKFIITGDFNGFQRMIRVYLWHMMVKLQLSLLTHLQ